MMSLPLTRKHKQQYDDATGNDTTTVPTVDNQLATAIIRNIIPRITRATRLTKPQCLHFTSPRIEFEQKYPDHFFCNKCDNVYNDYILTPLSNHKRNINSRVYKCVATHDNFISPSQLKPKSFLLKNDADDDDDDYDDINIDNDSNSVETNHAAKKSRNTHYDRKSLTKQVHQLEEKDEENVSKVRNMLNKYANEIETLTTALRNNKELLENRNNEIESLKNNYNNNKIQETFLKIRL